MTANERVKIASLRDLGDQLREMDAGSSRCDGSERATIFGRGVGFGIERIQMAGRSPQKDKQHRLGPPILHGIGHRREISHSQRKRHRRPHAKKRPPRHTAAGIRLKTTNVKHAALSRIGKENGRHPCPSF